MEWMQAAAVIIANLVIAGAFFGGIKTDIKWLKEWAANHDSKDDSRFALQDEARHDLRDELNERLVRIERGHLRR